MTNLRVRLQPRGGRTAVIGEREGSVVIRVSAPPVEGRANEALCAFIAELAGVPKGAVRVVAGERSHDKVIRVDGVDAERLRAALGLR
ncbi:MAG: DUF167 domain-containing protein [Chloroflexota bacterium]